MRFGILLAILFLLPFASALTANCPDVKLDGKIDILDLTRMIKAINEKDYAFDIVGNDNLPTISDLQEIAQKFGSSCQSIESCTSEEQSFYDDELSSSLKSRQANCASFKKNIHSEMALWGNERAVLNQAEKTTVLQYFDAYVNKDGRSYSSIIKNADNIIRKFFTGGNWDDAKASAEASGLNDFASYGGYLDSLSKGYYFARENDVSKKPDYVRVFKFVMDDLYSKHERLISEAGADGVVFSEGGALQQGLGRPVLIMGSDESIDSQRTIKYLKVIDNLSNLILANAGQGSKTPNKYIFEATGLALAGFWYPGLKNSSQWVSAGIDEIDSKFSDWVGSDGAWVERALNYDSIVARRTFEVMATRELLRSRGISCSNCDFASNTFEKQELLIGNWVTKTRIPQTNNRPSIGDTSNGDSVLTTICSLPTLNRTEWTSRSTVCEIPSTSSAANYPSGFFYFSGKMGIDNYQRFSQVSESNDSFKISPSNLVIFKEPQKQVFAIFNAMPKASFGRARTHTHLDSLSLMIYVNGEPVILDLGYNEDPPERRSIQRHSTIYNKNNDYSLELDIWTSSNNPTISNFSNSSDSATATASYNFSGTTHTRQITLNKTESFFDVSDILKDSSSFTGRLNYKLSPKLTSIALSGNVLTAGIPNTNYVLKIEGLSGTTLSTTVDSGDSAGGISPSSPVTTVFAEKTGSTVNFHTKITILQG
ncbi:MAG: heparinase II/III family protein [Candidatus Diapherotrites archaeon]|nr:heparinase II/III family protein [Candidatus Diapherotrites archaeon]